MSTPIFYTIMATMIPVVSICEGKPAIIKAEFTDKAITQDAEDFPITGTFGMSFKCGVNVAQTTEEEVVQSICENRATSPTPTRADIISAGQLIKACETLKRGVVFGMKAGFNLLAIAIITQEYTFSPEEAWGKHRWGYRVLRKATDAERTAIYARHPIKTFYESFMAMPGDITSLLRQESIRTARDRYNLLSLNMARLREEMEEAEQLEWEALEVLRRLEREAELAEIAM